VNTAHRSRGRSRPWRPARAGFSALVSLALVAGNVGTASAVRPAFASRIGLIQSDMEYILHQIKIAEAHPDGATLCTDPTFPTNPLACPTEVTSTTLPYGLRTVDGHDNNLVAGRSTYGASDRVFPRMAPPVFNAAETTPPGFGPDSSTGTSYASNTGFVFDSRPRLISNLISDQTASNPAATDAYNHPTGHGFGNSIITVNSYRSGVPTPVQEYELPNVAPDAGLSPSYNSLFTFFGQFFDHGLDHVNKGGSGTVFVPLRPDDPLYVAGSPTNFMVLTRATNLPGPDGIMGTADDIKDGTNSDSPYVDQSQTYTSHPSHQVFLREYAFNGAGQPFSTGRLLNGAAGGLPTWADVKAQAAQLLGIQLSDSDVLNIPLLRTDAYGKFIPGAHGFPQIATPSGFVEGDPTANGGLGVSPTAVNAFRINTAFLDDIAHNADPSPQTDPATGSTVVPVPDANTTISTAADVQPFGTYDNELLDAHYIAGDGRANENIGLTSIHHIFHSEHNGEVQDIKALVATFPVGSPADLSQWQLSPGVWNGERLFQAAKLVTEMEYQHIVFEEFARFVQPAINAFTAYDSSIDPAITAEFAHAVYRFGHSMLNVNLPRINADGSPNDIGLIQAFTNPVEFLNGGSAGLLTADQAAGSLIQGMAAQRGNAIDEFVTEALRNNLLGIPLDLATLNLTRARSEGIPTLNQARRVFYASTVGTGSLNSSLRPYTSWIDFGLALRHPASLINFIAAYGTHPTIRDSGPDGVLGTADDVTTAAAKRAAAALIVNGGTGAPPDSADFMNGTGSWADANSRTTTGLDDVDLWIGGLAEKPPVFGGLLGSTFNFVFVTQMQRLQDNDRFYYLTRLAGTHLLEQIEGSSFAKLAMRNTTAKDLPGLAFTKPDWVFDLSAQTNPTGIVNDPNTPYDETNLDGSGIDKLIRLPDGTIRLTGGGLSENHSLFAGTNGDDKIQGAEGDDSIWGNDGNDRIEGGAGNDHLDGGAGNDILTDSFGLDVLNGGDGNDVVAGGPGADLLFGGSGNDFIIHGPDGSESFGGLGNDFIQGGVGADTIQGNEGDDWIEGGGGADVLRGDNAAPFPIAAGGNDVLIGGPGNVNYGGEGGMDVLVAGQGPGLMDGGLGFDWVTYVRKPSPANADLLNTALQPPNPLNLNDRYLFDEAVSGGPFNDIIRGDGGSGPGHELTHDNLALINGLSTLLSSSGVLLPGTGATPAFDVTGNILLGGPGSDVLEGRGGNDFIDGDAWLNVRLTATDKLGNTVNANKMSDLQAAMLNGSIDPGTIKVVREILTTPNDPSCDTAVFSDSRANYTITQNANGTFTVSHLGGLGIDGVDTVRNIERLQFADKYVSIGAPGTCLPNATGTVTISSTTPTENQGLTATAAITDPDGFDPTKVVLTWQYQNAAGTWIAVGTGSAFTPNNTEVGFPMRVVASYTDNIGIAESLTSASTAAVINVNDPPTGAPVLSTTTPVVGTPVTVSTSTIADADGLVGVTFNFQWQAGTTNISGATSSSFTPTTAQLGLPLQVVVSYVDNHGTAESLTSAPTGPVTAPAAPVASVSPTSLTFAAQNTGTTSAPQTVTLSNIGTLNLVVSGVSLTGSNQLDFVVTNGCSTVLPGGSCTISVAFKPSIGGAETATLNINHNAGSTSTVALNGTGVVPAVLSTVASLDFSAQRINTNTTKALTVTNSGTAPLVFGTLSTSNPAFTASIGSCPASLAPNKSCKMSVTFRPTVIQTYTGTLTILSNGTNSPTNVTLTGSGKK
jgi:Ca2+-binding RTX toxin-like protein